MTQQHRMFAVRHQQILWVESQDSLILTKTLI